MDAVKTSTARRSGRLPALMRAALLSAGAALGVLIEARTGPLAQLPALAVFLLGSLMIALVAAAVARRSAWGRDDDRAWPATWRDVVSRPRVDAPVLLWIGTALGVLILDGPSVVGTVGVLVVIALMLPGAALRILRR